MAKGGGGSWKVAYADFVTAMMAFFLVMWIGAQDTKVRQSVANYFVDPSGVSKKPVQTGATLDAMTYGSLPKESSVALGSGTKTFSTPGEPSPGSKAVLEWVRADEKRHQFWKDKAQELRRKARSQNLADSGKNPEEIAVRLLSQELRSEITKGIPAESPELYKELIFTSFDNVNWMQLAEDIISGLQ